MNAVEPFDIFPSKNTPERHIVSIFLLEGSLIHYNHTIDIAALPDLKLTGTIERIALLTDQSNAASMANESSTSLFPSQSDVQNGFEILISGFK